MKRGVRGLLHLTPDGILRDHDSQYMLIDSLVTVSEKSGLGPSVFNFCILANAPPNRMEPLKGVWSKCHVTG